MQQYHRPTAASKRTALSLPRSAAPRAMLILGVCDDPEVCGILTCMRLPQVIAIALMLGVLVAACSSNRSQQLTPAASALDRLVAAHTHAAGGAAAIERVHSIEVTLTIAEPTYTVEGTYRASRDRRMRIDVYSGGKRVYTEAFDGTRAWDQGARDPHGVPKQPQATAALLHGIDGPGNLLGLHEAGRRGVGLGLSTPETLDGMEYDVVEARFPDGFVTFYYLNRRTHLIERQRDLRAAPRHECSGGLD